MWIPQEELFPIERCINCSYIQSLPSPIPMNDDLSTLLNVVSRLNVDPNTNIAENKNIHYINNNIENNTNINIDNKYIGVMNKEEKNAKVFPPLPENEFLGEKKSNNNFPGPL